MGEVTLNKREECSDNEYGQKGKYYDWEIKDAAQDIIRAERFKKDAALMVFVEKCLASDLDSAKKAVKSISDLKQRRQDMAGEDEGDGGES